MTSSLRKELNEAVITFPASKTAGAATLTGDVISTYEENTFGASRVLISTEDTSKITDTLTVKAYGSFDEGTTWLHLKSSTTLANGTGTANASVSVGNLVPRLRADAVFDATGALAADHGCKVDIIVEEAQQEYKKEVSDATTMAGDLSGVETEYTTATSLATPALLKYAGVAIIVEDASDITDGAGITYKVQTSVDGTYWTNLQSTGQTGLANGTGPIYLEHEFTSGLGKYIRVAITGTTSSALAAANIVVHSVLG